MKNKMRNTAERQIAIRHDDADADQTQDEAPAAIERVASGAPERVSRSAQRVRVIQKVQNQSQEQREKSQPRARARPQRLPREARTHELGLTAGAGSPQSSVADGTEGRP